MFVHVRATPGARKETVTKISDTEFTISVREKAERNQANKRIIELLGVAFGVTSTQVKMLTGHRSVSKMFSINQN